MNQLIEMAQPWVTWWSSSLWRASVEGGIAIAVVWMIARWCDFLSPRVICWLWRLVCLKLLVALFWAQPVALAILPQKAVATFNSQPAANMPEVVPIVDAMPPAINISPSLPQGTSPGSRITLSELLLLSWSLGVLCFMVLTVREWLSVRRVCHNSAAAVSPGLQQACQLEAARLGIRKLPTLRLSSHIDGPILTGFVRPTIILPDNVEAAFDASDVRLMLAHELASEAA